MMVEKEIARLLHAEEKMELKYKRAISKVQSMQVSSLKESKIRAEEMQQIASKEFELLKKNYQQNTASTIKKMQEKSVTKIKIIENCHKDLQSLARIAANELLEELN